MGFRAAAPGASRVGLPWEWAAAISGALLVAKRKDAAICHLALHDAHPRPWGAAELHVGALVPPAPRL
eukprot:6011121-Pyramimonas_sp.AAC.1